MYNTDFIGETERAKEHLFGWRVVDIREHLDDMEAAGFSYFLPAGIEILHCHKNTKGEWVPDQSSLEGDVETQNL